MARRVERGDTLREGGFEEKTYDEALWPAILSVPATPPPPPPHTYRIPRFLSLVRTFIIPLFPRTDTVTGRGLDDDQIELLVVFLAACSPNLLRRCVGERHHRYAGHGLPRSVDSLNICAKGGGTQRTRLDQRPEVSKSAAFPAPRGTRQPDWTRRPRGRALGLPRASPRTTPWVWRTTPATRVHRRSSHSSAPPDPVPHRRRNARGRTP